MLLKIHPMIKISKNIIISSLAFWLLIPLTTTAQKEISSVIKKAMADEIQRNMNELSLEGYGNPFFIAFAIGDIKTMNINSVLGSNISSNIVQTRVSTSRVMVGGYQMNDENYDSRSFDNSNDLSYLEVPLDDDYYGIRRAIWISVNNVYKSAAKKYKSKIKELERNGLHKDSLELWDFSKEDISKTDIEGVDFNFDEAKYKGIANELSALFVNHPEIDNSSVSIYFYLSRVYFVNSEGTNVSFPISLASVSIDAATACDDGTNIAENMIYVAPTPSDLIPVHEIEADIKTFIANIEKMKQTSLFDDSYEGPVLFQGIPTSNVFISSFFLGEDELIGFREPLTFNNNGVRNVYYGRANTKNKIGKKIAHCDLSVVAFPKLNEYSGINLIGTTFIDAEGVIPPDTIELLKEGKIVGLLNNRTPCEEVDHSNGHFRAGISGGYLNRDVSPSVIKVESSNPLTLDSLKRKLIQKAKDEDLEYALLMKALPVKASTQSVNVYKVDLETGEETLLRGLNFKNFRSIDMKDILGLSKDQVVVNNVLSGRGYGAFPVAGGGLMGVPYSIICPDAILFEEIELEGSRAPFTVDLPVVPSPLKEKNRE